MAAELELATDSSTGFSCAGSAECRRVTMYPEDSHGHPHPQSLGGTIQIPLFRDVPFVMTAHCIRGPFSSWGFLWLLSSSTSFLCWLSCVPKGGGEGLAIATSAWSPRHARLTTRNARVYGLGVCLSTRRRCITSLHLAAFFFLLPFHFLRMFLVRFLVVFALLLLCRLPLCAGIATRGSPFV